MTKLLNRLNGPTVSNKRASSPAAVFSAAIGACAAVALVLGSTSAPAWAQDQTVTDHMFASPDGAPSGGPAGATGPSEPAGPTGPSGPSEPSDVDDPSDPDDGGPTDDDPT